MEAFYLAEEHKLNKESQQQARGVLRWVAPPLGVFKINWDAAIDHT